MLTEIPSDEFLGPSLALSDEESDCSTETLADNQQIQTNQLATNSACAGM